MVPPREALKAEGTLPANTHRCDTAAGGTRSRGRAVRQQAVTPPSSSPVGGKKQPRNLPGSPVLHTEVCNTTLSCQEQGTSPSALY